MSLVASVTDVDVEAIKRLYVDLEPPPAVGLELFVGDHVIGLQGIVA